MFPFDDVIMQPGYQLVKSYGNTHQTYHLVIQFRQKSNFEWRNFNKFQQQLLGLLQVNGLKSVSSR